METVLKTFFQLVHWNGQVLEFQLAHKYWATIFFWRVLWDVVYNQQSIEMKHIIMLAGRGCRLKSYITRLIKYSEIILPCK